MKIEAFVIAALLALPAAGQVFTESFTGLNLDVPDNDLSGVADTRSISTSIASVYNVSITLTLTGTGSSGAYNGDYYAYVMHEGELAVLLNRPGTTASDRYGYDDNGLSMVRLDDDASSDVHTYRATFSGSGPLTGSWQPDGRYVSPFSVQDTDTRDHRLDVFRGSDPNGSWTLFIADVSPGGTGRLDSWSMEVTPVPEPRAAALVAGFSLLAAGLVRRRFGYVHGRRIRGRI